MKLRLTLLPFCLVTILAAEARADPFVLTDISGYVLVETSIDGGPPTLRLPPSFSLSGPGLTVGRAVPLGGGDSGSVQARDLCPCLPGTTIATNSAFSGLLAPSTFGVAIVNGVTYSVTMTGEFNFVSPPIELSATGSPVTVPFFFSGVITGEGGGPGTVDPLFTATLSGQGLATFRFEDITRGLSDPVYALSSIEYRFQTPEPTTLILLGSGLAALAGVARRRRSGGR